MAAPRYLHACIGVVVLTIAVDYTSPLSCYQCADSGGGDSDCRNASALLHFPKSEKEGEDEDESGEDVRKNKYHKDCGSVQQNMCMIETHMSQGNVRSYIRDCSDGKTFSFNVTKYPRLQNLPPNNHTTCTFVAQPNMQICITLCNSSLCNGPQIPLKEEIVCRNITNEYGDVKVTCGASSLLHVLLLDRFLIGVLACRYLLPFLVSAFFM